MLEAVAVAAKTDVLYHITYIMDPCQIRPARLSCVEPTELDAVGLSGWPN